MKLTPANICSRPHTPEVPTPEAHAPVDNIIACIDPADRKVLAAAAQRRDISLRSFVSDLLTVIVQDNLIQAVVDDGF